jgi:hypothetical protein
MNCGECDAEVNLSKRNPDRWRPGFSVEPFCQSGDKRHEFLSRLKGYPDLVNAALTVNRQETVPAEYETAGLGVRILKLISQARPPLVMTRCMGGSASIAGSTNRRKTHAASPRRDRRPPFTCRVVPATMAIKREARGQRSTERPPSMGEHAPHFAPCAGG